MTKTNSKKTAAVCWRLPSDMIDELGPGGIREMLERWRKSRRRVRVPNGSTTLVNRCYMVPTTITAAVEREAARLTAETGTAWSTARVVRQIWETGVGR